MSIPESEALEKLGALREEAAREPPIEEGTELTQDQDDVSTVEYTDDTVIAELEGESLTVARAKELAAKAKGADAYFTQRAQALSEQSKVLEEAHTQAAALFQAAWEDSQRRLEPYKTVNWGQLALERPDEYRRHYPLYESEMRRQQDIQGLAQRYFQSQTQALATQQQAQARESVLQLQRLIPGFGQETYSAMRSHALTIGYRPEEFEQLTDARLLYLIHQDAQRNKASPLKKETPNPAVPARASRPRQGAAVREAMAKLSQTGKEKDALEALSALRKQRGR